MGIRITLLKDEPEVEPVHQSKITLFKGAEIDIFDQFLLTVNQWISGGLDLAVAGAFARGMVSVLFSPCHLASIPLIVAYVGGQKTAIQPRLAVCYAAAFSIGLFITIAVVGIVCAMLGVQACSMSGKQHLVGGRCMVPLARPIQPRLRHPNYQYRVWSP